VAVICTIIIPNNFAYGELSAEYSSKLRVKLITVIFFNNSQDQFIILLSKCEVTDMLNEAERHEDK
jgi:hypothetical protein